MAIAADPQALRAFIAVAREGNVSRAAARLHLSQPAVSLQLKALADLDLGGGRILHVPKSLKGVAVFSFKRLCAEARGATASGGGGATGWPSGPCRPATARAEREKSNLH